MSGPRGALLVDAGSFASSLAMLVRVREPGRVLQERQRVRTEMAEGLRAVRPGLPVRDVAPAIIVNAAAYTAVDRAEQASDDAFAINARAPGVLAVEARHGGALIVHYSTDYLSDGDGDGS